jgi:hypothetical protein
MIDCHCHKLVTILTSIPCLYGKHNLAHHSAFCKSFRENNALLYSDLRIKGDIELAKLSRVLIYGSFSFTHVHMLEVLTTSDHREDTWALLDQSACRVRSTWISLYLQLWNLRQFFYHSSGAMRPTHHTCILRNKRTSLRENSQRIRKKWWYILTFTWRQYIWPIPISKACPVLRAHQLKREVTVIIHCHSSKKYG